MKKSRFTETQILAILTETESGRKMREVCRENGVSEPTDIKRMRNSLYGGKPLRILNVLDEGVRECLAIEVDTSLPALRLIQVLERIMSWRGKPKQIRLDDGPEMCATIFQQWCQEHQITLAYIQPGKPNQNAFIERFNRTFREEVLNACLFESKEQLREMAWWWLIDYNEERPHDLLGCIPPTEYRKQIEACRL